VKPIDAKALIEKYKPEDVIAKYNPNHDRAGRFSSGSGGGGGSGVGPGSRIDRSSGGGPYSLAQGGSDGGGKGASPNGGIGPRGMDKSIKGPGKITKQNPQGFGRGVYVGRRSSTVLNVSYNDQKIGEIHKQPGGKKYKAQSRYGEVPTTHSNINSAVKHVLSAKPGPNSPAPKATPRTI
jgi:hypothetical protein